MKKIIFVSLLSIFAQIVLAGTIALPPVSRQIVEDGDIVYASRICLTFRNSWSIHPNQTEEDRGCSNGRGVCVRACNIGAIGGADQLMRYKDSGEIVLILDKKHLANPDAKEIFQDGKMIISEDVPISSEVCSLLGFGSDKRKIPQGRYVIVMLDNNTFKVRIPIK